MKTKDLYTIIEALKTILVLEFNLKEDIEITINKLKEEKKDDDSITKKELNHLKKIEAIQYQIIQELKKVSNEHGFIQKP